MRGRVCMGWRETVAEQLAAPSRGRVQNLGWAGGSTCCRATWERRARLWEPGGGGRPILIVRRL